VGPIAFAQLQQLIQSGQVQAGDFVWRDGMANWAAASAVPGLVPVMATPMMMPPPPQAQAPQGYYGSAQAFQQQPYGYANAPQTIGSYGAQPLSYAAPLQYAGFWLRFVAAIIDAVILFFLGLLVGFVMAFPLGAMGADREATQLLTQLVGVIVGFLYFALQESGADQATLGKKAMGLKVTGLDGQSRISFGQATGRYFAKIISVLSLLIGYMMAGWTQRKQALHDMMAGTLVVKR
jgi:uncharacterized RDD family membrane protein YckC